MSFLSKDLYLNQQPLIPPRREQAYITRIKSSYPFPKLFPPSYSYIFTCTNSNKWTLIIIALDRVQYIGLATKSKRWQSDSTRMYLQIHSY